MKKGRKGNRVNAYLLNSLGGEHKRMFLAHTNTILDPDAHTPESLGPAVGIGDVEAAVFFSPISVGMVGCVEEGRQGSD